MSMSRCIGARCPEEHHEYLPSHIERREECGDSEQNIDWGVVAGGIEQDFVLAPEASQREDTSQRQRSDDIHECGCGHLLRETAHQPHILRIEYVPAVLVSHVCVFAMQR